MRGQPKVIQLFEGYCFLRLLLRIGKESGNCVDGIFSAGECLAPSMPPALAVWRGGIPDGHNCFVSSIRQGYDRSLTVSALAVGRFFVHRSAAPRAEHRTVWQGAVAFFAITHGFHPVSASNRLRAARTIVFASSSALR